MWTKVKTGFFQLNQTGGLIASKSPHQEAMLIEALKIAGISGIFLSIP